MASGSMEGSAKGVAPRVTRLRVRARRATPSPMGRVLPVTVASETFGERPLEDVGWEEADALVARLSAGDLHSVHVESPDGDVQLTMVVCHNGRVAVNWHSWSDADGPNSFVLVERGADDSTTTSMPRWDQGRTVPGHQTVAVQVACVATKRFFVDDGRAEELDGSLSF